MQMDVIVLGAGTAIPAAGLSPASILLRAGTQEALIDCGPGTISRAALQGVDYLQLQTIFLTHLHSDHTLDLVTLLQANDSTPGVERRIPLSIYGCVGTREWFDRLMIAYPGVSPSTYPFDIIENGRATWSWSKVQVSSFLTGHTANSLAYRFTEGEGSFVFTGDAVFSEDLIDFCSGVDLLLTECSFPEKYPTRDHLSADQVGILADQAGVRHLAVTHQYPPALAVDIAKQIGRYYSGSLTLARDGSSFSVSERR